ncbi:hypothetical protein [Flavobacterium sp. GCM10023249]|uniref:hypothetical protein n=1 Tax=unclassified Flavobacterium TaxID=196869 RepID=UPI003609E947
MKISNIFFSIITALFASYFINIVLTYKEENIIFSLLSVFFFPAFITIILIYITSQFKIDKVGIEAKRILTIFSFLLICYSIIGIIYTIYFREYGPWTTRTDAVWLNSPETKKVLAFPIGMFGLLATLATWFFLYLTSNKQIKLLGYILYVILVLLIFLANNKATTILNG